jgi:hypothetical protein
LPRISITIALPGWILPADLIPSPLAGEGQGEGVYRFENPIDKPRRRAQHGAMNACLILAAKQIVLAAGSFTLLWSEPGHDARWEEDWTVGLAGFQLIETRVSGDGLQPPEGAERNNGVWYYHAALAVVEDQLLIERQPAKGGAWQICTQGTCWPIPPDDNPDNGRALLKPCP